GQGGGPQLEMAVCGFQQQPFTVEEGGWVQAEFAHKGLGLGVGAQQNMLAVIDICVQRARMNAACPAAQGLGSLEYGDDISVALQTLGGGQARPTCADDSDFHRPRL